MEGKNATRCPWVEKMRPEYYNHYHDVEWGTPVHDERLHFEFLVLEAMSCGLSWELMLKKREILRQCFAHFEPARVARFSDGDVQRVMGTEGMIKSIRKIKAMVSNAQVFLDIQEEFGTFDRYIWGFTGGRSVIFKSHRDEGVWETRNALSDCIAKSLKRRGFKYMGSVILYSHLQAIGIINDHHPLCFRYRQLLGENTVVVDDLPSQEGAPPPLPHQAGGLKSVSLHELMEKAARHS